MMIALAFYFVILSIWMWIVHWISPWKGYLIVKTPTNITIICNVICISYHKIFKVGILTSLFPLILFWDISDQRNMQIMTDIHKTSFCMSLEDFLLLLFSVFMYLMLKFNNNTFPFSTINIWVKHLEMKNWT